jgi:quinol monooxygenase YgiN
MLIIAGTIEIDPSKREPALAAAREMMAETLKEKGCHAYTFSADLADPSRIHLFERWESEEALLAHFATPHMAAFQKALAAIRPKADILKYQIASSGPVR